MIFPCITLSCLILQYLSGISVLIQSGNWGRNMYWRRKQKAQLGKAIKTSYFKEYAASDYHTSGMNLATIVCGSFIIESVFGWPGIGTLAMTAIGTRDYPVIMAYVMMSGIILVVGNFIADILYAFADPRIKREDMANG